MQSRWVIPVLAPCWMVLAPSWTAQPLRAQSPDAESTVDRLTVERVKAPSGSSEISVTVTGRASSRVIGYQFAVGHDPQAAWLVDVQLSDAVGDHGADLVLTTIENEADAPFGAILVALDASAPFGDVLPIDLTEGRELARFVYDVQPAVQPGQSTTLELRHRAFGTPPVAAIFVDEDLNSIRPAIRDGEIRVAPAFLRGDCNHDSLFDVSDPVSLLLYLFRGDATPPCPDSCDANDDGKLNLSDSLLTLNFLFSGGTSPAAPYPETGVDASSDSLPCLGVADSE